MKLDLPTIDPNAEADSSGERLAAVRGAHVRPSGAAQKTENSRGKHAASTAVSVAMPAHAAASSAAPVSAGASACEVASDPGARGRVSKTTGSASATTPSTTTAMPVALAAEKGKHAKSYAALAENELEFLRRRSRRTKWAAAIACVVVLAGAGVAMALGLGSSERQVSEAPSVLPVDESPVTVKATVKADGVLVDGPTLSRGVQLSHVEPASDLGGDYADSHYRAVFEGNVVYIEKKWVRTASEETPGEWVGYAAADAIVYARHDLSGEDILTLALNEEVTVIDEFNGLFYVCNADGYEGYVPADKVLREKVDEAETADPADDPSNYYYGGSSGSSAASSSGGSGNSNGSGGSSGSGSNSGGGASSGGSGSGSSSGGAGASGSGSASGGSSSGSGSGSGGSGGSSGSGSESEPGDGDEMLLPVGMTPSFDRFLLGVGVAYADEIDAADLSTAGSSNTPEEGEGLTAVVLADEIPTFIAILNRGDEISIKKDDLFGFDTDASSRESGQPEVFDVEEGVVEGDPLRTEGDDVVDSDGALEDLCTVVVHGQEALMPEKLLRLEGEAAYEQWKGYALEDAVLYADYRLTAKADDTLPQDDSFDVIDAIDTVLVVEKDGRILYIDEAFVLREPLNSNSDGTQDADAAANASDSSGASGASNGGSSNSSSGSSWSGSSGSSSSGSSNSSASASSGSSSSNAHGSSSSSSGSSGSSSTSSSGSASGGNASAGSGSSSGGGGESSDGSSSGSSTSEDEWTPPKL